MGRLGMSGAKPRTSTNELARIFGVESFTEVGTLEDEFGLKGVLGKFEFEAGVGAVL